MDLTLNPQHLDRFADLAWAWMAAFLPHLIAAVIILVLGAVLARWVSRAVDDLSQRMTQIDPTLRAVVGAAGLAIGLALQGTLSNIAAGLMLLWLRPFRIGDFIEVDGGVGGTVREIGLFATQLETFDGVFLFAPNAVIWNKALKNHTRNAGRLVSVG